MKRVLLILLLMCSAPVFAANDLPTFTPADSPDVRFVGRAAKGADGSLSFDWSGCYFTFRFEGRWCAMRASDSGKNYFNVFIDGKQHGVVTTSSADSTIVLADKLSSGAHTVVVQKRTEGEQGRTTLYGLLTKRPLLASPAAKGRHIEFIGDSHTCGYGTEGKAPEEPFTPETENCNIAWSCITARCFDADYTLIAHSGQGIVRNWGDTVEVSDCSMRHRMLRTFDMDSTQRWNFHDYTPDIVVVKLGSNDFSPEITPSMEVFNRSYAQLLRQLREAYGDVPVLCVVPADNLTLFHYIEQFVADQNDPNLHLTAMLPGITNWDSDMGANYHPNLRGQRKMAMAVIPFISTLTGWEVPNRNIQ